MLDYQLVVKFAEFRSCEGLLVFGEVWRVLDELVECHRRFGDVSRDVLRHVAPGIVALCVNLCELFCKEKYYFLSCVMSCITSPARVKPKMAVAWHSVPLMRLPSTTLCPSGVAPLLGSTSGL